MAESRINVNAASVEQLGKLQNLDPAIAAAIVDWVDSNDEPTPQGAEQSTYAQRNPPYQVRNGPFETLREMSLKGSQRQSLVIEGDRSVAKTVSDSQPKRADAECICGPGA